jgi:uncharacterized protein YijF (DUF1287 family)
LRQQFTKRLVAAAIDRTRHSVRYVSDYVRIPYPNGDVPTDTGVCTDEIIRSYRAVGVDLQKEVHEEIVLNFSAYPNQKRWRLDHPDSNIDHRRVEVLRSFFGRAGTSLPIDREHVASVALGQRVGRNGLIAHATRLDQPMARPIVLDAAVGSPRIEHCLRRPF